MNQSRPMTPDSIAVTLVVARALQLLGVRYLIVGPLASAWHGVPRSTLDADLVADLQPEHTGSLLTLLQDTFYADEAAVAEAIRARRSFNVIHLATMVKVDIFVAGSRPFDQNQLENARLQQIGEEPDQRAYIATAEDTILAKLEWYRRGGEISERQWRDVLGIVKVQGDRLDRTYMVGQAHGLGVADLLQDLFSASK
jgi:hypothetical protein